MSEIENLSTLSGFITSRLQDLESEIKDKYKFLKISTGEEISLFRKKVILQKVKI